MIPKLREEKKRELVEQQRENCYPINSFVIKLARIGIYVELSYNLPWIYLTKVNGKFVEETFYAEHGFTAFWFPVRRGGKTKFTNRREVFKKVREMLHAE